MKIGWGLRTGHNSFLRSWRSPNDPSSGDFSFKLDTGGLPEFYLWKGEFRVYRTGPWNGIRFSGIPNMQQGSYIVDELIEKRDEVAYTFRVTNHSIHSRFTLSPTGLLQMFTWSPTLQEWNMFWYFPSEKCDLYSICGSYSYCDMNTSPICNCIKGFVPKNVTAWNFGDTSDGCVRQSRLSCGRGDRFLAMMKMKLPVTGRVIVDRGIGLKECEERCFEDCNCTGFANMDIRNGGSGCVIWTGQLMDMRTYVAGGGQDLYVKLGPA